jgi:hypothetical protein
LEIGTNEELTPINIYLPPVSSDKLEELQKSKRFTNSFKPNLALKTS